MTRAGAVAVTMMFLHSSVEDASSLEQQQLAALVVRAVELILGVVSIGQRDVCTYVKREMGLLRQCGDGT
jgi:hypothetical protein